MAAVLLALSTALAYGVANYVGPLLGRRLPLGGVLLVGQSAGLVVSAVVYGVHPAGADDTAGALLGLAAGTVNAVAIAGFYRAAQVGELSLVAPIGSCGAIVPVLVALASGERPAPVQLLGIPVALFGIGLAARRGRSAPAPAGGRVPAAAGLSRSVSTPADDGAAAGPAAVEPAPAPRPARGTPGLGWALVSAAGFGGFLSISAHAAGHGATWSVMWSRVALVVCTGGTVALLRLPARIPLRLVPAVTVPGILLVLGTTAYAEATRRGLLSVVSVLATLNPVVTVGLALLLLGERLGRSQWAGVVTALAGVVLLAVG